jgi:PKD repeat protein
MLSFDWNTIGWAPGHTYALSANATALSNETDTNNNHLVVGTVMILFEPPTADFTYSPDPMIENQTTFFDANNSTAGSGTISEYVWNFGDGNSAVTPNSTASHVYESKGTYNITLTVQNTNGLNDTIWKIREVLRHDIAVTEVAPDQPWVYKGTPVTVNVTLLNSGDFNETVTVDLYYNLTANQQIGTIITNLSPNETKTLTFTWNTTGLPQGKTWTLWCNLSTTQYDSNLTNNIFHGPEVTVYALYDLNKDRGVDILDMMIASYAFGSSEGEIRWNPLVDANGDRKINILDLVKIAHSFCLDP